MAEKYLDATDSDATMLMDFETSEQSIKSEMSTKQMSSFADTSTTWSTSNTSNTWTHSQPAKSAGQLPSSYLDLDDILAQTERIPCEFRADLYGLGYLDPSTLTNHMAKGTKLELPLWMARDLYKRQMIKVQPPKAYSEAYREVLDADPTVVDLQRLGPNYYKVGEYLVRLGFPEAGEIAASLVRTFYERLKRVLEHSLNLKSSALDEGKMFKKRLDNAELQLYEIGKQTAEEMQKWENKQLNKIQANPMVIDIRKRRQAAISACASNYQAGTEKTLI